MSSSFNDNFRKLFLIIAKSASEQDDCPLPYSIIKMYIDRVFTDEYDQANRRIFKKYSCKVDEILKNSGSCLDEALKKKDRSIFESTSIIPEDMIPEYKNYTGWFSRFLRHTMPEKHMDVIFRYIKTLKNQV